MPWQDQLKGNSLSWLLTPDSPGVRYLALRDLLDCREDDPELSAARQAAHTQGPIAAILAEMNPAGYWVAPLSGEGLQRVAGDRGAGVCRRRSRCRNTAPR